MPRTWGYIIIAAAALVGVGALVLPIPEGVVIKPIVAPPAKKAPPPTPAPTPRNANRGKQAPKPKPPPPPPAKVIPRQDTTKSRTVVDPKT